MTGSTNSGPIQAQQDTVPLLDDSFFIEEGTRLGRRKLPRPSKSNRNKMSSPAIQVIQPVQLTPLWEYVVRTKKFPKDEDVLTIFYEISDRLRDPEWEVRQHALRVLVDVLPTLNTELIDNIASLVLPDLIDNLGNSAPAILQDGLNRTDVLDNYQTSVAKGVIVSTPLLLFPSRSSVKPSKEIVREATQALAMRLVQVTHQESALRSLAKIRDTIGEEEFNGYLHEIDDSMKRNFELLCDVYAIQNSSPMTSRRRPESRTSDRYVGGKIQRKDSTNEALKETVDVKKSWKKMEEDAGVSLVVKENEESTCSVASTRVVLETEIKFDEETAITMTILEEQEKEVEGLPIDGQQQLNELQKVVESLPMVKAPEIVVVSEERRKTPRRVHFGGEVVKLRTPDSEDAESVVSEASERSAPTRIPLPVSPATRMPFGRRARSSSQPSLTRVCSPLRRRSASSSPRRESHTHDASLSPKKSILAKSSEFGELQSSDTLEAQKMRTASPRASQRDSSIAVLSPRGLISAGEGLKPESEPSFCVYEEPGESFVQLHFKNHRSSVLGDICGIEEERIKGNVDYVFGDRSGYNFDEKMLKDQENFIRSMYRSKSATEKTTKLEWSEEEGTDENGKDRRRIQSAKIPGFEVFPRQERNYILMELSSPVKDSSRRTSLEDNQSDGESKEMAIGSKTEKTSEVPSNEINEKMDIKDTKEPEESHVDSNKRAENEKAESEAAPKEETSSGEMQLEVIDDNIEKATLDAKERLSDISSDGEWKNKEPSWEELGVVDEEVLNDFHNKYNMQHT
ncbi:PREDICTED: uncharacterized protein LOC105364258 [Ceratosolen solmsi marchali]|uniref:Uncharacterized protein LOC105364258 n=1 Tax=Ceratosolen solmsi marchali TaxID=326594 RepID=A0AAJ7DXV7_9HYME|nr:PREDICTED: uncharacterized protein LOC105364258 [Ceratosolen solmsi marchali]